MSEEGRAPALEPIVAHGSRMSWAGIMRPGDEFSPAYRSRLAVLTANSGMRLGRYYGAWSSRYRRFTTNLSTPQIFARALKPGDRPGEGVQCILHWVSREDMIRIGSGSVSHGDGWPEDLWKIFTSELENLPPGSVCEKLRSFADSRMREDEPIVAEWRALLQGASGIGGASLVGRGWIPVPAKLDAQQGPRACVVSWSPSGLSFRSLQEALDSNDPELGRPDLRSQAKYYLECMLAKLHGVAFGREDAIEDANFEKSPAFADLVGRYMANERDLISNPEFGRLDRYDRPPA
ncbi:MAG: hypothetical protein JRM74_04270 [Nitrososphaerota archaeon]|nr:hypothetical protein [Nitrososphaerota archaeon]MDG6982652.1 hypothetical protein [Nitrososphaerota archaeon]MDG6987311.1 hypothetical protein [Nitrososphaerota archaeon]MDG7015405.1 hypothetical protein [Nitrososphaerota archaeon]WGO50150.1 MAG: hypothetical protein JRM93_04790 [Nitrososphaerota archaeon]